jgi:protein disulfide-isomerase A1
LKGKVLLSVSQVSDGLGKRLGDYVGVKETDLPTVRIVQPKDGEVKKFVLTEDITAENILKFFEEWSTGTIKSVLKSEEIPENDEGPVVTLVGKNFDQIVLDETKDVLVEFYAPWCGHCKSLVPIYDELATKLKSNTNIVIAKMDSTANEVEGVPIQGFPTIKFFKANDKKNPMDFKGDRTLEGFVEFLKKEATVVWGHKVKRG